MIPDFKNWVGRVLTQRKTHRIQIKVTNPCQTGSQVNTQQRRDKKPEHKKQDAQYSRGSPENFRLHPQNFDNENLVHYR